MCPRPAHQEWQKGRRLRTGTSRGTLLDSYDQTLIGGFLQNDGCLNFVDENDEVLISGFGRSGKAKGDIPGVRFKVVKVSGVGLLALWKEKKVLFGLPRDSMPFTDRPNQEKPRS